MAHERRLHRVASNHAALAARRFGCMLAIVVLLAAGIGCSNHHQLASSPLDEATQSHASSYRAKHACESRDWLSEHFLKPGLTRAQIVHLMGPIEDVVYPSYYTCEHH